MTEPFHASNYQILVVDDDPLIVDVIRMYLESKQFPVVFASNGNQGLAIIKRGGIDLIVLDVMMPDMDGFTMCERIRATSAMPILMVTAKGESPDKLRGFDLGADDYLVKPFDPNELVARVTSLLRRAYQTKETHPSSEAILQFGQLRIDMIRHTVAIDEHLVDLTAREYQLLCIFAQHPNHVLERQQLLDLVWGIDYLGDDRVVDVFVKRIRQKLTPSDSHWAIVTIRGMGYKFEVGR